MLYCYKKGKENDNNKSKKAKYRPFTSQSKNNDYGRYFIETSTAYSHKITTYQDQFRKSFLLNFSYFKVDNIGQWIRALNSPAQFKKLIQTQKDCRLERGVQNV